TCEMVQAMWGKVLKLPEQKAARVIRMAVTELD
ncbi:MAG TPA: topoisomerase II, partial [Enterobacter sp.]|nr:topoisomerase II [Enterobacter sp.]